MVYVDQAENAFHFFQNEKDVQQFIAANKTYKRTSYIRFLYQDFTKPLPILDNEFDLIIALFAGGIAASCERYLKKGGYLLTNNHNHNAEDAIHNPRLELESVILKKGKKYEFIKKYLEQFFVCSQKKFEPILIIKQSSRRFKIYGK